VLNVARLYVVDELPNPLVREWRDLPGTRLEGSFRGANGEFQGVLVGRWVLPAIDDCGLIDAGVQGGPELIQQLAQFQTEGCGQRMDRLDPKLPCPVVIYMYADVIGIRFIEKVAPGFPESLAVSLCPVYAVPTGVEVHGLS
jgi:hypothetical protein